MNRQAAIDLLDRLHSAQNEFYAGGSGASLSFHGRPSGRSPVGQPAAAPSASSSWRFIASAKASTPERGLNMT